MANSMKDSNGVNFIVGCKLKSSAWKYEDESAILICTKIDFIKTDDSKELILTGYFTQGQSGDIPIIMTQTEMSNSLWIIHSFPIVEEEK